MTSFNAPAYDIDKPTGQCAFTGRTLEPGDAYVATLVELDPADDAAGASTVEAGLGLRRLDVSIEAWDEGKRPDRLFGHWRTIIADVNEKKRLFVDDDILLNLFHRLADTDQPQRLAFRFVLGLILMRKRMLRFEGTKQRRRKGEQQEMWLVVPKGGGEAVEVLNPNLEEQQVQEVAEQLGEVLSAEL
jgi:hypothetical protein